MLSAIIKKFSSKPPTTATKNLTPRENPPTPRENPPTTATKNLTPDELRLSLKGKSSNEILKKLREKYPTPPDYIDVSKFTHSSKTPGESIDTSDWKYVRPQYVNNQYTGNWIESGQGGILNNDDFIVELLLNEEPLIPTSAASAAAAAASSSAAPAAAVQSNGGRRPRRLTRVKSKKRANKRRTRSRK